MSGLIPTAAWQAEIVLPAGVSLNVVRAQLQEEFREVDSTAYSDGSFTASLMTGQQLRGDISGWANSAAPGLGSVFNAVNITFTAPGGWSISGTFNIYGFMWTLSADDLMEFRAMIISTGPYAVVWGPVS